MFENTENFDREKEHLAERLWKDAKRDWRQISENSEENFLSRITLWLEDCGIAPRLRIVVELFWVECSNIFRKIFLFVLCQLLLIILFFLWSWLYLSNKKKDEIQGWRPPSSCDKWRGLKIFHWLLLNWKKILWVNLKEKWRYTKLNWLLEFELE